MGDSNHSAVDRVYYLNFTHTVKNLKSPLSCSIYKNGFADSKVTERSSPHKESNATVSR